MAGGLAGGLGWELGPVELGPRAGLELGRIHAAGFGVDHPGEASVLWVALRAGASGTLAVAGPLGLRLDLGLAVPLSRPRWVLERVGPVDRPAAATARGALGLEARF